MKTVIHQLKSPEKYELTKTNGVAKNRISFSVDSLLATTEQNYHKNIAKNKIDDGTEENRTDGSNALVLIKNQLQNRDIFDRLQQFQLKNSINYDLINSIKHNERTDSHFVDEDVRRESSARKNNADGDEQKNDENYYSSNETISDNDNYKSAINLSERLSDSGEPNRSEAAEQNDITNGDFDNNDDSSVGSDVDVEDVDGEVSNISDRAGQGSPELKQRDTERDHGLVAPQALRAPMPRFFQSGPPAVSWPFPAFTWIPANPLFRGESPNCTYALK